MQNKDKCLRCRFSAVYSVLTLLPEEERQDFSLIELENALIDLAGIKIYYLEAPISLSSTLEIDRGHTEMT